MCLTKVMCVSLERGGSLSENQNSTVSWQGSFSTSETYCSLIFCMSNAQSMLLTTASCWTSWGLHITAKDENNRFERSSSFTITPGPILQPIGLKTRWNALDSTWLSSLEPGTISLWFSFVWATQRSSRRETIWRWWGHGEISSQLATDATSYILRYWNKNLPFQLKKYISKAR